MARHAHDHVVADVDELDAGSRRKSSHWSGQSCQTSVIAVAAVDRSPSPEPRRAGSILDVGVVIIRDNASRSPRLQRVEAARTISTFSCDIARAVSRRLRSRRERLAPTAAEKPALAEWVPSGPRHVGTVKVDRAATASAERPCERQTGEGPGFFPRPRSDLAGRGREPVKGVASRTTAAERRSWQSNEDRSLSPDLRQRYVGSLSGVGVSVLLRQPHGFEGFRAIQVNVHSHDLSLLTCDDLGVSRVQRSRGRGSLAVLSHQRDAPARRSR